jgi:hypothetical protein
MFAERQHDEAICLLRSYEPIALCSKQIASSAYASLVFLAMTSYFNYKNFFTSSRNSVGFSACTQCPAPSIVAICTSEKIERISSISFS